MSLSWKTSAALVFCAATAFGGDGPSLSADSPDYVISSEAPQPPQAPPATCPSMWHFATELAPSMSFIHFYTYNAPLGTRASIVNAVSPMHAGLAGFGLRQNLGYGETLRLRFLGAYSGSISGTATGFAGDLSTSVRTLDAMGELAFVLAADTQRRICFDPFVGYALLDVYMKIQVAGSSAHTPWDHLRYYGPMGGLGLSLRPASSLMVSAKMGYIRSHLWDKQQSSVVRRGKNRLHTILTSMRFDYYVTERIATHATLEYQGWSAAERYIDDAGSAFSSVPYLRRVQVGFGARVNY